MTKTIPNKWLTLFKLIPSYDSVATAGDCWFDHKDAEKVVGFIETQITHIEGELSGQFLKLEPWQKAVIGCAFGWKRPDGTRRYREALLYVPRKNGKTMSLAAIINAVAFCDGEPGAQIYSCAADKEQATLVYRQAAGMVLQNPELAKLAKIYRALKSIEYPNGNTYKALSSEANTKHGFNTHLCVVDELHAQSDRELVDVMITSTGSRRQPMMFYITTADFMCMSICNEKYEYACRIRDGEIQDECFLPAIWEAKFEDDWKSPEVWAKANPNLGVSLSLEYIKRECTKAANDPAYENTFRRLHLNQRTEQDVRAIQMDLWKKCAGSYALDDMRGMSCTVGLDLSSKLDVTAVVCCFQMGKRIRLWPIFFVPEGACQTRERQNKTRFDLWVKLGYMQTTPGNSIQYSYIRRVINEASKIVNIKVIGYDPWSADQFATEQLRDQDGFEIMEFRQGYHTMTEPTKHLLGYLADGILEHPNNPCLTWMAGNFATEEDAAGNLKPNKEKSTEKIDGIVASIMSIGLIEAESNELTTVMF